MTPSSYKSSKSTSAIAGTEKDNIATIIAATATTNCMRLVSATSCVPWRSPLDRSYYSRDYPSEGGSGMGKSSQEGMGICPRCPTVCPTSLHKKQLLVTGARLRFSIYELPRRGVL